VARDTVDGLREERGAWSACARTYHGHCSIRRCAGARELLRALRRINSKVDRAADRLVAKHGEE
jgi:hypothetical protein